MNVQGDNWFIVRKKFVVRIGKLWNLRYETLKFKNVKFNFKISDVGKWWKNGKSREW